MPTSTQCSPKDSLPHGSGIEGPRQRCPSSSSPSRDIAATAAVGAYSPEGVPGQETRRHSAITQSCKRLLLDEYFDDRRERGSNTQLFLGSGAISHSQLLNSYRCDTTSTPKEFFTREVTPFINRLAYDFLRANWVNYDKPEVSPFCFFNDFFKYADEIKDHSVQFSRITSTASSKWYRPDILSNSMATLVTQYAITGTRYYLAKWYRERVQKGHIDLHLALENLEVRDQDSDVLFQDMLLLRTAIESLMWRKTLKFHNGARECPLKVVGFSVIEQRGRVDSSQGIRKNIQFQAKQDSTSNDTFAAICRAITERSVKGVNTDNFEERARKGAVMVAPTIGIQKTEGIFSDEEDKKVTPFRSSAAIRQDYFRLKDACRPMEYHVRSDPALGGQLAVAFSSNSAKVRAMAEVQQMRATIRDLRCKNKVFNTGLSLILAIGGVTYILYTANTFLF